MSFEVCIAQGISPLKQHRSGVMFVETWLNVHNLSSTLRMRAIYWTIDAGSSGIFKSNQWP
jgi:hypothetical protein